MSFGVAFRTISFGRLPALRRGFAAGFAAGLMVLLLRGLLAMADLSRFARSVIRRGRLPASGR
jgi:hypothetical protein